MLQLVRIRWHDAHFDFDSPTYRSDYIVETVGYVINIGERFLSIASEVLPDSDGYRATSHIPKWSIEEVEELVPVKRVSGGYRFGSKGKVYRGKGAKAKAAKQGRAIKAAQAGRGKA